MKIRILKGDRTGQQNLKVIQGIRMLNWNLSLREARDISVDGGTFKIINKDENVIETVLECFDMLGVECEFYKESTGEWIHGGS